MTTVEQHIDNLTKIRTEQKRLQAVANEVVKIESDVPQEDLMKHLQAAHDKTVENLKETLESLVMTYMDVMKANADALTEVDEDEGEED